jgi:methylated-DNA-[protein]-cysteine S-methyltransferase
LRAYLEVFKGFFVMNSTTPLHLACTAQTTIQTPLGHMLLARTAQGLCGLWFESQAHHPGTLAAPHQAQDELLQRTAQRLRAYFLGEGAQFDDLPLDLIGTTFQCAVWKILRTIPPGTTRSYGDIAKKLNPPSVGRAVGSSVGRNPISIIVPCHRVMSSTGALTGYAGGLDRKKSLLTLEKISWANASVGVSAMNTPSPACVAD